MERIVVQGQSRQIVCETHPCPLPLSPPPLPSPTIFNITRAKWTGGMAQVVKYLLYKCKALNSNLSHTKNKKKRKNISLLFLYYLNIGIIEYKKHICNRVYCIIIFKNL
jgi:hypothetical protein